MEILNQCRNETCVQQEFQERSAPANAHSMRHYANVASALFLFSARVVAAVVQLRIVEKVWGGPYSGLNALSNQVLLYVTLLELGLAQSAISLLYEPIADGNFNEASAIIIAVRRDVRRLAALGTIILLPLLAAYTKFVHSSISFETTLATLWLIALSGVTQLASVHFQVYLNAAERIDRVNYILAVGYLLKTAAGLTLAIHWHQYLWLPAMTAILTLGEFAALRSAFLHGFRSFCKTAWGDAASLVRNRAKFVLVHKAAGLAFYQSDFIILSLTTSLVVVKDYAKYQYVSAALLSMVGMVATALTTSIARQQLQATPEGRRRGYVVAQFATGLIGAVLMLGYWFTAPIVVDLAFGRGARMDWYSIALFGLALFLNVVKTADDVFITANGAFEVGFWIPLIEAPIYIATGVLLSRQIGFSGILLASITTNLLVSVLIKGLILAKPVFDTSRRHWFTARALNIAKAIALILPLAVLHLIAPKIIESNMVRLAAVNSIAILYTLFGTRRILCLSTKEPLGA